MLLVHPPLQIALQELDCPSSTFLSIGFYHALARYFKGAAVRDISQRQRQEAGRQLAVSLF